MNTPNENLNVHDLFPSRFLKGHDLKNKTFTLTVARVALEAVRVQSGEIEHKPVVYFDKARKGLLLNKTNAMAIADLHGADMGAWVGKPVTLSPVRVTAFGKTREVVRVATE